MPGFHLRNLRNLRFHQLLFRRVVPLILLLLSALALLNLLVDPYGVFHILPWGGATKYKSALGLRIYKAQTLRRPGWDVIILGNSRPETGLAPTIPAWDNLHVYNAALPETNMTELLQATRLALQNPDLKQIMLCVDLDDFAPNGAPPADYAQSLFNPQIGSLKYPLSALFGFSATDQSLRSMYGLLRRQPGDHSPQGLLLRGNPRLSADQWLAYAKHLINAPAVIDPQHSVEFEALLDLAAQHYVQVTTVILPTHVIWLECIHAAGCWPVLENWNQEIVRRVDNHNQKFPDQPVAIISCVQFIRFTEEPLPPPGQPSQMAWWRDPVHFTVDLGNLVTDRVTNHFSHKYADAPDFSLRLTTANIDDYLKQLKKDRDVFIAKTPWITEFMQSVGK